ncbi:hypothetical protein BU14_0066s0002 [Porphyra umbilicalis]|uniref:Uncharacterized protein n=1 Tax=Porphyra umbilicalis TaxID=2786 RepID=A0A1X6PGG8_PORUM|nr:hypothetical protein BU14_0066s0002 [Porphyra umbilicalis]|eukprot:OSX79949.1 hypothetical protein BU14_0066s0002 [Porphyra umbilicalis]
MAAFLVSFFLISRSYVRFRAASVVQVTLTREAVHDLPMRIHRASPAAPRDARPGASVGGVTSAAHRCLRHGRCGCRSRDHGRCRRLPRHRQCRRCRRCRRRRFRFPLRPTASPDHGVSSGPRVAAGRPPTPATRRRRAAGRAAAGRGGGAAATGHSGADAAAANGAAVPLSPPVHRVVAVPVVNVPHPPARRGRCRRAPPPPPPAAGTSDAFRAALTAYLDGEHAPLTALLDDTVVWESPLFALSGKAAVLEQLAATAAFLENPAVYFPPASVADAAAAGVEWTVSGVWGVPTRPRVLLAGGSRLRPHRRAAGGWRGGGGRAGAGAGAALSRLGGLLPNLNWGGKARAPPPPTPDEVADALAIGAAGDAPATPPVAYEVVVQPGRMELVATTPLMPTDRLHGMYEVPIAPAVLFTGEVRRREQYESVAGITLTIEAATAADVAAAAAAAAAEEEAAAAEEAAAKAKANDGRDAAAADSADGADGAADGAAAAAAWDGRRVVRWSIPAPSAFARTPPPAPSSPRVAYVHAPTVVLGVAPYTPPDGGGWAAAAAAAAGLLAAARRDGWAVAPGGAVRVTQFHGKVGWNGRGAPAICTFATVPGAARAAEVAVPLVWAGEGGGGRVPPLWEEQ